MEGRKNFFEMLADWGPLSFIMGKIRNKLLAAILITSLVPLVGVALVNYNMTVEALAEKQLFALRGIQEILVTKISDFFLNQQDDIESFAKNPFILSAAVDLVSGTEEMGNGDFEKGSQLIREIYLKKAGLADADDGSTYSLMHSQYHAYFTELANLFDYKDIYLVDPSGNVVYSVTKSDPYGTNLVSGLYAKEGLGRVFKKIKRESGHAIMLEDFSRSQASPIPTAFYAARIHSAEAEDLGLTAEDLAEMGGEAPEEDEAEEEFILITEISIEKINALMTPENRLGKTDEMYLVGSEGQWRNDSRFLEELGVDSTMLNPEFVVDTEATRTAQKKEGGMKIIKDYRGTPVLSAWSPVIMQEATLDNPEEIIWSLIVEIDETEINLAADEIKQVSGFVILGTFLVILVISFMVSGGLVRQVDAINSLFSMIGMGDFSARAEVRSKDEIGDMAISLNTMLDNTLTLIQSQEERDSIQESIKELLEEVSVVAEGDLSIDAVVKDDVTGSIADSFNYMIQQLRDVIRTVQDATIQVSSSANEIQTTAEHLAQGSESQASQILDTSAAIDEMAVSIQQVSENAALSATVGEQAKVNAQQGTKSVQNTILGMNKIRGQVQETAKRIKRLGESSQEIGDIVQLIGDIADRTSILALNASIQAAMAGDAGRGFAVVAEEVERLADRSTNATKQIDGLIKTIQSEMAEAVTAMETTTQEVVDGSQIADQAGQALTEIEGVSNRLSELIQSISLSAKQQARGSEALATSMNQIADVTQQTAAGTKQAAVSINSLAHLADGLRGSVSTFKLPDNGGSAA